MALNFGLTQPRSLFGANRAADEQASRMKRRALLTSGVNAIAPNAIPNMASGYDEAISTGLQKMKLAGMLKQGQFTEGLGRLKLQAEQQEQQASDADFSRTMDIQNLELNRAKAADDRKYQTQLLTTQMRGNYGLANTGYRNAGSMDRTNANNQARFTITNANNATDTAIAGRAKEPQPGDYFEATYDPMTEEWKQGEKFEGARDLFDARKRAYDTQEIIPSLIGGGGGLPAQGRAAAQPGFIRQVPGSVSSNGQYVPSAGSVPSRPAPATATRAAAQSAPVAASLPRLKSKGWQTSTASERGGQLSYMNPANPQVPDDLIGATDEQLRGDGTANLTPAQRLNRVSGLTADDVYGPQEQVGRQDVLTEGERLALAARQPSAQPRSNMLAAAPPSPPQEWWMDPYAVSPDAYNDRPIGDAADAPTSSSLTKRRLNQMRGERGLPKYEFGNPALTGPRQPINFNDPIEEAQQSISADRMRDLAYPMATTGPMVPPPPLIQATDSRLVSDARSAMENLNQTPPQFTNPGQADQQFDTADTPIVNALKQRGVRVDAKLIAALKDPQKRAAILQRLGM